VIILVVRREKRSRKRRGTRSVGWGRIGQHRKAGAKGGVGKAGRHKHKWSWTVKYGKDAFGKHGFKRPYDVKEEVTINILQLNELINEKGLKEINLSDYGYTKLLGRGSISQPITVKVKSASKGAIEKIKKAGGQILLEEGI
jgi:large subunit ribosomal protein L15